MRHTSGLQKMTEARMHVRIPQERLGVLIGPNGSTKTRIEETTNIDMKIDSREGDVEIMLRPDADDPTQIFHARDVVTAIGRGFAPECALRLLDETVTLEVIDLRELLERSQAALQRIKSRIIGKNGKTRRLIEELTGADVCVYGHTVSIIGGSGQFEAAREAIEMLIEGRYHKTVYGFLHRKRRELKKEELRIWNPPSAEKTGE